MRNRHVGRAQSKTRGTASELHSGEKSLEGGRSDGIPTKDGRATGVVKAMLS